jgi:hypothetical protein
MTALNAAMIEAAGGATQADLGSINAGTLADMQAARDVTVENATLANAYANSDTDADIPGGAPGERGAKYWAGEAGAIVPTLAANLEGVPWLNAEAQSLTGIAAGLSWSSTSRMIARAIKELTIEGQAGAVVHDWFIGTFCNADGTNGDQITLRRVDSPTTTVSLGVMPLAKLTNQPTPVVITSAALGLTFRLLIDYGQITSTGVLINTSTLTVPLIAARSNGPVEREKRNFNAQIKEAVWLDPDAPALKGLLKTYNCRWTPDAEAVARAVKDVRLTDGWDTTNRYRITRLAYNATAPNSWRVSIGDIAANSIIDTTTTTQTPITDSITRIDINNGVQFASLWVDYRELVSGQAYTLADSPLLINNLSARPRNYVEEFLSNVDRKLPYWNLVANGALDPDIGTYPTGQIPTAYYDTPSAVQADRGCVQAVEAGSGGKFFYQWENVLSAASSGQYYLATMMVHSPDGTTWGNAHFIFYAGATLVGGGSPTGFISLGPNDRLYYRLGQFPVRSDLTQFRLGTNSTALSVDNKFSGAQLIISSQRLTMSNTNRNDWYAPWLNKRTAAKGMKQASLANHLAGANIAWMGDSVVRSYNLPTLLATELGCTVQNFGFPGLRLSKTGAGSGLGAELDKLSGVALAASIASGDWTVPTAAAEAAYTTYGYTTFDYRPYVAAMAAFDWSTATVMPVSYGTNDWAGGVTLGTAGSTDQTTINGALNEFVRLVQGRYPLLPIVIGAPMFRMDSVGPGDSNDVANSNGVFLSDIQAAMRARADYFQLPCWEPAKRVGFNKWNYGQSSGNGNSLYSNDGLHPTTAASQARIISRLGAFFRSAI